MVVKTSIRNIISKLLLNLGNLRYVCNFFRIILRVIRKNLIETKIPCKKLEDKNFFFYISFLRCLCYMELSWGSSLQVSFYQCDAEYNSRMFQVAKTHPFGMSPLPETFVRLIIAGLILTICSLFFFYKSINLVFWLVKIE